MLALSAASDRRWLAAVTWLFAFGLTLCAALDGPLGSVLSDGSANTAVVESRTPSPSSIYNTRFANVTWNQASWQLSTTALDQGHYQSRMSVANGYIGINVAALGPFFEVDTPVNGDDISGWPLFDRRQTFATVGGFWDSQPTTNGSNFPWLYQYGWDTAISGIPHWAAIVLDMGTDMFLDASTQDSDISNFSTTLDMKSGLMNWAFTWTPKTNVSFDIAYQMFAHKLHVNQAFVRMEVTSTKASNMTMVNVLNGDCAVRTASKSKGRVGGAIYSAVSPNGVPNVTAFVYVGMSADGVKLSPTAVPSGRTYLGNNESSIAEAFSVALEAGQSATFTKFVGIASSDAFSDANATASSAMAAAMKTGYETSLNSHAAEWSAIFPADSVDDYRFPGNGSLPSDPYVVESAITAVVNPYFLLQNTIGANASAAVANASVNSHSIAVGGLGSSSYAGQIFWDAEIWMQPGLVASFPQAAQGIANYRVARYGQALANVKTAYQSSKNQTTFSSDAAVFPWTSGRFGNCTATGPCFDYEYHINGDIAQEFVNYWVSSGDTEFFQTDLFPVYNSIATFYAEVLTRNGSQYALTNMTDPDEYANMVDNGGFTMPLIADTLTNANMFRGMFNMSNNDTWTTQAENVVVGRNAEAGITLEYIGMNGSVVVKQADVVLDTFPLSYQMHNYTSTDSLNDLDYYAAKQSLDGPGMTYAIFSIVANEVSPSGCAAYTYQQYSEKPYARAPWFQLSEQLIDDYTLNGGTHPAYPFLTGHGGANQVVLFGYLGLRLMPDWYIHVDPALPPQIPQIKYRTFYWHGWPISASSNYTHTTMTRLSTPFSKANMTFANTAISVQVGSHGSSVLVQNYTLPPNGTITFPNRTPADNKTVEGNLAQCQSVTSSDPYEKGQFPIAAVDGAASTKWQPSFADRNASLTVELPSSGQKVSGFYFDWAQAPPVNFSVVFHNESSISSVGGGAVTVAAVSAVKVSSPWNASREADIVPYESNSTTVLLTQGANVYAAKYATLTISGSQATENVRNGTGATVAEWAIVADSKATKRSLETLCERSDERERHEHDERRPFLRRGHQYLEQLLRFMQPGARGGAAADFQ